MADDQNPQLPLDGGTPPNPSHVSINLEEEMRHSYLAYSMSVIIGRALPDARDGLKPVHRRILTAMDREGLQHNKRYSKCAGVVGECLKKYHPHGDSSVYDALVRMAQPWSLRYPLIDGQGNFGSVDGDPPAAYRYTECRMERIAEEMMADIEMETVDMMANFDETTDEPTVLPTRIPTLLVNGSNGIAVGMATNIPPHNLTEVVNAAIELVKNPKAGLLEVLKHVQGPDFPTGGFIYGKGGIVNAYKTGRGRFMMRARVAIENLTKENRRSSSPRSPTRSTNPSLSSALPNWSTTRSSTKSATFATSPIATACASSLSSSAPPSPRSCSISSTSTRRCRKASP